MVCLTFCGSRLTRSMSMSTTMASLCRFQLLRSHRLSNFVGSRFFSASAEDVGGGDGLVVKSCSSKGVTVLRMNNPKKLNGWTASMLNALFDAFEEAEHDEDTKVVILTGTGKVSIFV